MPQKVRAIVFARQEGRCADTGVRIGVGAASCEYDHRPALWERRFDPDARKGKGDTIPPANDPEHIQAIVSEAHKARTARDAGRKAKGERCAGAKAERFRPQPTGADIGQERDRAPIKKKSRPIQSRGFAKGGPKQKIPSRKGFAK